MLVACIITKDFGDRHFVRGHRIALFILVTAISGLALAPAEARASGGASWVALTWDAPSGCPDATYVEHEVERLLGGRNAQLEPYLRANARVQPRRGDETGPWRIDLRTEGPQGPGVRTIAAESCQALADATSLILALAIDPARVAALGATASTPALTLEEAARQDTTPNASPTSAGPAIADADRSAPAPRSDSPPPETRVRSAPIPMHFAAMLSAMLDAGTLPAATPGMLVRLAMTPGSRSLLRLELGVGLFLDDAIRQPTGRSGMFSLRVADADACLVTRPRRLELGGCVGAEAAWISAEGLYESVPLRGESVWPVLRARATGAYFASTMWALRVEAGGGLDLIRPEFAVEGVGAGPIDQPARITGRGALGLAPWF